MKLLLTVCVLAKVISAEPEIKTNITAFRCIDDCCAGQEKLCATNIVVSYSELEACRNATSTGCRMTGEALITRRNNPELVCQDDTLPGVFGMAYGEMDLGLGLPWNFLIRGLQAQNCKDWTITADTTNAEGSSCEVTDPSELPANQTVSFTPLLQGSAFNISLTPAQANTMGHPAQIVRGLPIDTTDDAKCAITFGDATDLSTETWVMIQTTGRVAPVAPDGALARVNGALLAGLFVAAGLLW